MPPKTKIKPVLPLEAIPYFKYEHSNTPWGLRANYKGHTLEFFKSAELPKTGLLGLKKLFSSKPPTNSGSIDLYSLMSVAAKKAWDDSYKICKKRKGDHISVEDLFLALLKASSVQKMMRRLKVNLHEAEKLIKNYLKLAPPLDGAVLKKIPFEAFVLSVKLHNHKVGSLMLLGGLLKATPRENILQAIFTNIGLTAAKLELFAVWFLTLNYEFPTQSTSEKLMYTMTQAENMENHFGYFFEFPAIEKAMQLSRGQTLKDLEHKKALQLLVKAAGLARAKGKKTISANMIGE